MIGKNLKALFDHAEKTVLEADPELVSSFADQMRTLGQHLIECADQFHEVNAMQTITEDDIRFLTVMTGAIMAGKAEVVAAAMLDRDYQTRNS